MKIPKIKIYEDNNKILRSVSKEVTFPLSDETKKTINDAIKYLECTQDEELSEKYDLRPGMGLAFIQLGIPERIFVITNKNEDETFERHTIINPKIISMSEEMIYVGEGEGCLSVNREIEGIVPRHARITVKSQDLDGNEFTVRVREDIAIAFQHEIDHLNGILFYDHIDKKDPYKDMHKMREI